MKTHFYALACALLASTIMTAPVNADDVQQITPLTSTSQNIAFEYSARKILGLVSEARAALDNKNKEDALNDVDMASHELDTVRNIRNYMEMTGAVFGRVFYGNGSSYYIPVADDTYAVRTYKRGPFWSSTKGTAVSDVKIVMFNLSIDPEKAATHLQNAQKDINDDDYKKASRELKDFVEESLNEVTTSEEPFAKLADNIYLTRVLLRQGNHDGARYTLRSAKSALKDYKKTLPSESDTTLDNMQQQIDALNNSLEKRDPGVMKKATDTVEKWWGNVKSWNKNRKDT